MDEMKQDTVALEEMLIVSDSPHLRSNESVRRTMLDVIIALLPATIGSIYFFGMNALMLVLVTIISAVVFEAAFQKLFKRPVRIGDLSAVVTGLLLALNLPATAPWWVAVFGSGFAIIIVKEFFGGVGQNFMNPALAARAALVASWPGVMTNYVNPDGMSVATPLTILKDGGSLPSIERMVVGNIGGVIGETSVILLLIGVAYLFIRKVIDWRIPVFYIATTAVVVLLLGESVNDMIYHLLGGGLIIGAFFMATDYASSPVTPIGRIIFGVGCGLLTALIRVLGGMPEGVSYSILLMNVATPVIDRWTKPRVFGVSRKREKTGGGRKE